MIIALENEGHIHTTIAIYNSNLKLMMKNLEYNRFDTLMRTHITFLQLGANQTIFHQNLRVHANLIHS